MAVLQIIFAILTHLPGGLSQSSQPALNPSLCIKGSPVTAFPNCNYMDNTIEACNNTATEAQFLSCFCTQAILNSIIG